MKNLILILACLALLACNNDTANTSAHPEADFVYIEAGKFLMGSPSTEANRSEEENDPYETEQQHEVTISGFYMATHEVTQAEYEAITGANPSRDEKGGNYPVEMVTWDDAIIYCNLRSIAEGLDPVYYDMWHNAANEEMFDVYLGELSDSMLYASLNKNGYRLPTEAEWEYAARAGTSTAYSTGEAIAAAEANYASLGIKEVGSYAPNAWGLYDMHGNVAEWLTDLREYPEIYELNAQALYKEYFPVYIQDPVGRIGRYFNFSGGSWYDSAPALRSAKRNYMTSEDTTSYIGFRLARSVPSSDKGTGLGEFSVVFNFQTNASVTDSNNYGDGYYDVAYENGDVTKAEVLALLADLAVAGFIPEMIEFTTINDTMVDVYDMRKIIGKEGYFVNIYWVNGDLTIDYGWEPNPYYAR